jgi:hypothetical protein
MKMGNAILRIRKVDVERFLVDLEFRDGSRGVVDLSFLFRAAARRPLALEILRGSLFAQCFVDAGALAWPNGLELCPDAIRHWIEQGRKRAAA